MKTAESLAHCFDHENVERDMALAEEVFTIETGFKEDDFLGVAKQGVSNVKVFTRSWRAIDQKEMVSGVPY